MNIHVKIGIALLAVIALTVLIVSLTSKEIFSLFGSISLIGLSLFGIYAFGTEKKK